MERTLYGFYSQRAAELYGTVLYKNINGGTTELTGVVDDPKGTSYGWADKVFVGVVTKYLARGSRGICEHNKIV